MSKVFVLVLGGCSSSAIVIVIVKRLLDFSFRVVSKYLCLITLIKYLIGHKSLGSLFEGRLG